eukprot:gene8977-9717_t
MNTCVNTLLKDFFFRLASPFKPVSVTSEPPQNEDSIEDFTAIMELGKYGLTIKVDWKFPKNRLKDPALSKVAWAYPREYNLCMRCEKIFVFNRWPHHCRACGVTICNGCTYYVKAARAVIVCTKETIKPANPFEPQKYYCKHQHRGSPSRLSSDGTTEMLTTFKNERIKDIQLLPFSRFKEVGKFPNHVPDEPTTVERITVGQLTEEEYERSIIIFVSHKWIGDNPDDEDRSKYKLCIKGIEEILKLTAADTQCYLWIDRFCLPQPLTVELVSVFPDVIKLCDIVFTPILDNGTFGPDSRSVSDGYPMFMKHKPFKYYADRGWCRTEMALSLAIPPLPISQKRLNRFRGGLRIFKEQIKARPHIVYGTRENKNLMPIQFLPQLQIDFFRDFKPKRNQFTKPHDYKTVANLMKDIKRRVDLGISRFNGDVDVNNVRRDGNFYFSNNDYYCGEFSGNIHGYGRYTFSDGDVYRGQFIHGKMHGVGTMVFASGTNYSGEWKNDKRHGKGLMHAEDDRVIEGTWEEDKLNGLVKGEYRSKNLKFDGEYKNGKPHGTWKWRYGDDRTVIVTTYDEDGKVCSIERIEDLVNSPDAEVHEVVSSEVNDVERLSLNEGLIGLEDVSITHDAVVPPEVNKVERRGSILTYMERISHYHLLGIKNYKTDVLLVWSKVFVMFIWYIAVLQLLM